VCGLHIELCVCGGLPRVDLPFGVLLVQHFIEEHRPTNTGRLIAGMVNGSRLVQYGRPDQPLADALFRESGRRYILLFPRSGARVLARSDLVPSDGTPVTMVVPDGNWRQASRVSRRTRALQEMQCMALPPGPPGAWTVRNGRRHERLCTAEAVIRAVELAGMRDEAARMHAAMVTINDRTLGMRPKHAPRTGGAPHRTATDAAPSVPR
jgi:DTW domain-containing protein YfiP